jgi:hypothetical protein
LRGIPFSLVFPSFTGLGIGGEWGAGQGLIAESVPPNRRARYAAYVQVGRADGGLSRRFPRTVHRMARPVCALGSASLHRRDSGVALAARKRGRTRSGARRSISAADVPALKPNQTIIATLFIVLLINCRPYWRKSYF